MLSCRQITELVTDYLEGKLGLVDRVSFQLHVGMCRHCRAYLRQMKTTVRTTGRLGDEPIPDAVKAELLARFRTVRPRTNGDVPRTVTLFAALERAFAGRRGVWVVPFALLGLTLLLVAPAKALGPLGEGGACLATVLGVGLLALVGAGFVAAGRRVRLSAATYAALSTTGALVGCAVRQVGCPMTAVALHALVFHVGGVALAAVMGALASRLPVLRGTGPMA